MQQDDLEFREQVPTAARETRDAYGWVAVAALTGTAVMSSQISLIGRFVGNCRNKRDCMYCALLDWSAWAHRLARPALRPMAREAFELVSHNRHLMSQMLGLRSDADLARRMAAALPEEHRRCDDDACGKHGGTAQDGATRPPVDVTA